MLIVILKLKLLVWHGLIEMIDTGDSFLYFHAFIGSGSGASKWTIHMEGGGWCYDEDECAHPRNGQHL